MSDAPNNPTPPAKLTAKQRAFIEHYLAQGEGRFNASEAARLAGYSPKTAGQVGYENLRKPEIQAAIAARLDELKVSADEVLTRLADYARGSLEDFISLPAEDEEQPDPEKRPGPHVWKLDLVKARKAGKLHLVKKLKWGEFGPELELYDAQAPLMKLGEHHGLWKSRVEIDATLTERISAAADEAERKLARLIQMGYNDEENKSSSSSEGPSDNG